MAEQGTFIWNELATSDVDGAKAFYSGLLGWKAEDMPMPGGGGTYTILKNGDAMAGGMFRMEGDAFKGVPPHWMSYIEVDDVDAAAAKVTELGGQVMQPPFDVPDVGRITVLSDPQGAVVALMKSAPME